ncbi:MAG: DUF3450 domain-containing protein [Pseudomonadota bacterium]
MKASYSMTALRLSAGAVLLFFSSGLAAQSLSTVLAADIKKMQANEASQKRVEAIVSETEKLENQYRQVTQETDGLNVFIELMQNQVNNQNIEIEILDSAADKIAVLKRQIVPKMKNMIDTLGQFVELDVPFLEEERSARIDRLNALLERADVTVSEKFRQVTEAYKTEAEYGRTIEHYRGKVDDNGTERDVDFLRIGRIGLYWQTADGSITKGWDHKSKQWVDLGNEYRSAVKTGLQVAEEQRAPEMLLLPVPAPEAS